MKIKVKIILFCMIFVSANIKAQHITFKPLNANTKNIFSLRSSTIISTPAPSLQIIPGSFYTDHFGFFCKKEWQLEKRVKVPFKFRLGSIQQVDYLEGKPNSNFNR